MLNPDLYARLRREFGAVDVQREDIPLVLSYESHVLPDGRRVLRSKLPPEQKGEEYAFNCPFCGDTRKRLSISYCWGQVDPKTRRRDLSLMHCYNEECQQQAGRRNELYLMVYTHDLANGATENDSVAVSGRKKTRKGPCDWPGAVWLVSHILKAGRWNHASVRYLQDRYYDPRWVAKHFHVAYCLDSRMQHVKHRIVVPLFYENQMRFWQARYLGNTPDKKVPKWYSDPDGQKSQWLYNIEKASQYRTVVLTEGAGDVWSVGLPAVAVMGKTISVAQLKMLERHCREGTNIAVMFDPKQDPKSKEKGRKHHIEVALEQVREIDKFRDHTFPVWLPEAYDPGFLDRHYLWDVIKMFGQQAGIRVRRKRWPVEAESV